MTRSVKALSVDRFLQATEDDQEGLSFTSEEPYFTYRDLQGRGWDARLCVEYGLQLPDAYCPAGAWASEDSSRLAKQDDLEEDELEAALAGTVDEFGQSQGLVRHPIPPGFEDFLFGDLSLNARTLPWPQEGEVVAWEDPYGGELHWSDVSTDWLGWLKDRVLVLEEIPAVQARLKKTLEQRRYQAAFREVSQSFRAKNPKHPTAQEAAELQRRIAVRMASPRPF